MLLSIVTPQQPRALSVAWLEVETPTGNLVIQPGHAPLVTLIKKNSTCTIAFGDGSLEQIEVFGGILHVRKAEIMLIIEEI
jgi:F0F1-type ATP synthase epsilon subunit